MPGKIPTSAHCGSRTYFGVLQKLFQRWKGLLPTPCIDICVPLGIFCASLLPSLHIRCGETWVLAPGGNVISNQSISLGRNEGWSRPLGAAHSIEGKKNRKSVCIHLVSLPCLLLQSPSMGLEESYCTCPLQALAALLDVSIWGIFLDFTLAGNCFCYTRSCFVHGITQRASPLA